MSDDHAKPKSPYAIENPNIQTGEIVWVGDGWLLNPVSTAPITLLGASREIAEAVKRLLEQSYNAPEDTRRQLAGLIETHALTFKELRHTLESYRVRCFAEFEKLRATRQHVTISVSEAPAASDLTVAEIRDAFGRAHYTLKRLAGDAGLDYSSVLAHFRGSRPDCAIETAARSMIHGWRVEELRQEQAEREEEELSDLQIEAERLAGVPASAAEILPIWEDGPSYDALAREIVARFRKAGAINLRQLQVIDPGGMYGTQWTISGPIDYATCAECKELMKKHFGANALPTVPVHPGCRCTVVLDISDLERRNGEHQ